MQTNNIEQFLVGCKLDEIDQIISDFEINHRDILIHYEIDKFDYSEDKQRLTIWHKDGIVTKVYYG